MRNCFLFTTILLLTLGMASCDDDNSSSPATSTPESSLCERTGGVPDGDGCACNGVKCTSAKWCGSNGKCDGGTTMTSDLLCIATGGEVRGNRCACGGTECAQGVLCSLLSKECSQNAAPSVSFADLCAFTGGTMQDGHCRCGETICTGQALCAKDGTCSVEAGEAHGTSCTNDENDVGQLRTCTAEGCTTAPCTLDDGTKVSCDGNACGTCRNYVSSCQNNADGAGVVSMCRAGRIQELYTCEGGLSCLKKDCTETGCVGEIWCGECHDGDFVCKNGNVPPDTSLKTDLKDPDNYPKIKVPQGTIVGMRDKCIDGKWVHLALDDPENCYFGYLKDDKEEYPHIDVNGKTIVMVWNYNSYGQEQTKYSLAACSDDGVHCGECAYSFSYCSLMTEYTCHDGKLLEQPCNYVNGTNPGCNSGNACYPASTAAYCSGTQCQNCKSICNW